MPTCRRTRPDSDADTNISDALVALRKLPAGVFLSFAGKADAISWVMESVSARKVRASGPAYRSTNRGPVATVEKGKLKFRRNLDPVPRSPSRIEVSDRVLQLSLHPGIDLSAMIDVIELREIRGVVVSTYPAFTAPSYPPSSSLPDFVSRCGQMDVAVALTVGNAPVGRTNAYGSTLHMIESDALLLSTMPEVALVKMMWATGCCPGRGRGAQPDAGADRHGIRPEGPGMTAWTGRPCGSSPELTPDFRPSPVASVAHGRR